MLLALAAICMGLSFVWGLFALRLGQDIAGDQLYYHFYTADALLRGRFWSDLAAGGLSGFNNPTLYFPFAGLVNHFHARTVGFVIGAFQGLNLALVFLLTYELSWASPRPQRCAYGATAAVLAAACPIVQLEAGRTLGDDWVSVPFLTGILLLLSRDAPTRLWRCIVGGLLIGVAAGLKYTNLPLAAAFGIALAAARPQLRMLASVAVAMLLGALASATWWFWLLYKHFGSPLFPYYNSVFRSPFFPPADFHDTRWQLHGIGELLTLPFRIAQGTTRVVEDTYRESHWGVFVLLTLASVAQLLVLRKGPGRGGLTREMLALHLFTILAFLIWAALFHYIRYLMVAELTVTVSIVLMLRVLIGRNRTTLAALLGVCLLSVSVDHYLPLTWARMPFGARWYDVPDLSLPFDSVVILNNGIGFIERALPRSTTIVGLGTNFFFAGLPTDGGTAAMNNAIHRRAWRTPDRVYVVTLSSLPASFRPEGVSMQLGFSYDPAACRSLQSNLGVLTVCHLAPALPQRPAPAQFVATG